ncbi:hypothetical protein Taro_012811 [Colocasia esculenta]|uniref:Uncharacterized protein n=1 Tax=Colocasia esculenta TaxID=4460 RepID=A0A843UE46_COLES|nr:hypothetical protein [Colocasia esculenta]
MFRKLWYPPNMDRDLLKITQHPGLGLSLGESYIVGMISIANQRGKIPSGVVYDDYPEERGTATDTSDEFPQGATVPPTCVSVECPATRELPIDEESRSNKAAQLASTCSEKTREQEVTMVISTNSSQEAQRTEVTEKDVPGPTTSVPVPWVVEPTTSAPLPLAAGRLTASASPSHMASGSTPPPSEPLYADDEMSHHEGEGSYNETMRAVWINEGYDLLFSMFMRNHRFTEHSDGLRARSAWTTTARANFKHLMYNVRRNAKRACASTDKNQWKEHGPVWMRMEYWIELCDIWGAEKWNENSAKAKQNRATHPEANVHTSGSVSFATHKARLEVQLKRPP